MVKAKVKTKYIGMPMESGTFTTFYRLKNRKTIGFKDFESKKLAQDAYDIQKSLAAYDLAPKVYGKVRKIDYFDHLDIKRRSNWGYITEVAETIDDSEYNNDEELHDNIRVEIDNLTDEMEMFVGISFYDCHFGNVGYVNRNGKKVLVCIDTGEESFSGRYAY